MQLFRTNTLFALFILFCSAMWSLSTLAEQQSVTFSFAEDNFDDAKSRARQECLAKWAELDPVGQPNCVGSNSGGGGVGDGGWVETFIAWIGSSGETIFDGQFGCVTEAFGEPVSCTEYFFYGYPPEACPAGTGQDPTSAECREEIPAEKNYGDPDCCPVAASEGSFEAVPKGVGNPVNLSTGYKYQEEADYIGSGPFPLAYVRHFNSSGSWTAFYRMNINFLPVFTSYRYECIFYPDTLLIECGWNPDGEVTIELVDVKYPDGHVERFKKYNGVSNWSNDPDLASTLVDIAGGYQLTNINEEIVIFNSSGKVTSVTSKEGITQTYSYPTDQIVITHDFGRSLTFDLDTQNRIYRFTDPAGEIYEYFYDGAGNLSYVLYPNGDRRDYSYQGNNINAIFDNQVDYVSLWYYDSFGRAYRSVKNGNVEDNTLDFTYIDDPNDARVTTTNPLGKQIVYHLEEQYGVPKVVEIERLASASSASATMFVAYDANGYAESETDWNGNTTLYTHDADGLELSRTEAAGTADERTITTTWHADFRLPIQINEPGLTKSYTYDSNGNLLTETFTDTTTSQSRTTTYTYNTYGQVLTMDGPRTDVSDITTYSYDAQGNLTFMTNALNQTTQFTSYDAHGNLLYMTDPNGVVTSFSYDERQRLTSVTRAAGTALAATTSFTYDFAGNIKRITQPNGAYIQFTYDKAYRVTDITDNFNNRISYTLDNASNIIGESVYDASGTLKRTQSAVFDDLSRMLESIGAQSQTFAYQYDDEGNTQNSTDARFNSTSFSFDALNRLISQTNPEFDAAGFAYDDQDRLTQVTDERGLTTSYSYNGFGEVITQNSPDTGTTSYQYDAAGNLTQMTDARGETTQYQYDALNRLTATSYVSDASLNESYTYDQGSNGIGRLTGFTDFSGSTSFAYDALGRVVGDTRTIYGISKTTSYDYDLAGNITGIGYPSGAIVSYSRDALGRITNTTIDQSPAESNISLVSNVSYLPFGGITGFDYGNGLTLTRQHDQDYRITYQDVSGGGIYQAVDYDYDANSNITDMDDLDDFTKSQLFQYDALNRLYQETSTHYGDKIYTYDEVGNRTLRTLSPPGQSTTNQTHTIDTNSNQLLSRGPRDYSYDSAGNTTAFDEPDGSPRREWQYSAAGRMEELSKFGALAARYQYNGLGQRVMKTLYQDNGSGPEEFQVFVFYYDQRGRLIQNSIYRPTATGIRHMRDRHFIWMDDSPVGFLETVYRVNGNVLSEDIHYLSFDHLNTPTFATNQNGIITWSWDRDAFGLGDLNLDPDGDGVNVNIRLRFPGQYDDEESITFYNYFRDYDPTIGRYVLKVKVRYKKTNRQPLSHWKQRPIYQLFAPNLR